MSDTYFSVHLTKYDNHTLQCAWHLLFLLDNRVRFICLNSWWRHQTENFSVLLAICAGNSPVSGEFPAQRPVTRSFYVFFDLRPNKRLSKQLWGCWFEMQSPPLWRHSNVPRFKKDLNLTTWEVDQTWKLNQAVHQQNLFVWYIMLSYAYW